MREEAARRSQGVAQEMDVQSRAPIGGKGQDGCVVVEKRAGVGSWIRREITRRNHDSGSSQVGWMAGMDCFQCGPQSPLISLSGVNRLDFDCTSTVKG